MANMMMNFGHHLNLLSRFDRGYSLQRSVFETVKKGNIVFDAGCGSGVLSVWAAQAGAKKVYAVDNGD
jgi:ribosomal protein L11 methylase PrmA